MPLNLSLRNSEEKIEKTVKEIFSVLDSVPVEFARLERETTCITDYDGKSISYVGLYKLEGGELSKHGCSFSPGLVDKGFFDSIKKNTPFVDCGGGFVYFTGGIIRKGHLNEGEEVKDWQLIWQNTKYQVILDHEFNPIPYAQWFNYHNTPFSDKYVDLNEEFIDFLKNHPWVLNKDEIKVLEGGEFSDVREFVEVLIKPDFDSYKEIWNSFDTGRRRATQYIREASCGFRTVRDRKSKDWFGILPFLKSQSKG